MADGHRHRVGLARREFLQVGFSGLIGLGASGWARRAAAAPSAGGKSPTTRSVVLIFLTGGPSHLETFDLKPDAPEGIRGEFKPIATSAAGIQYGEHLPKLARHADKLAIVRSMSPRAQQPPETRPTGSSPARRSRGPSSTRSPRATTTRTTPARSTTSGRSTTGARAGSLLPTFLMEGPLVWAGPARRLPRPPSHDPDADQRRPQTGSPSRVEALKPPRRAQRRAPPAPPRSVRPGPPAPRRPRRGGPSPRKTDPLVGQRQGGLRHAPLQPDRRGPFQIDPRAGPSRETATAAHMFRPVARAGPAVGGGRRADDPGQFRGGSRNWGLARATSSTPSRTASSPPPTPRSRPSWTTCRPRGSSPKPWSSSPASSGARPS
jgi:hypothetical protein